MKCAGNEGRDGVELVGLFKINRIKCNSHKCRNYNITYETCYKMKKKRNNISRNDDMNKDINRNENK